MTTRFLLYGATGFVGAEIARRAVRQGLQPIVAGRDRERIASLASELGVEPRAFALEDSAKLDAALREVPVVLHCAGPYVFTSKQMADGCLRCGTHYLDITGEIPVYEALAARDAEARARSVMLLPGVGFDVVPTDCLALYLKQRLPSARSLTLAFHSRGPAGLPPGTLNTMLTLLPHGDRVRRDGRLVPPPLGSHTRLIDFGRGPVRVTMITWGDVFMAYYSTGIRNITVYTVIPAALSWQLAAMRRLRALFRLAVVRSLVRRAMPTGSTPDQRARTNMTVWGEVRDDDGRVASARMQGPEAGVEWTAACALAAVRRVLSGNAPLGFQTPAKAYGADFVLETAGVIRQDLP
jgi:short subunit dehydrogenase-like uncharacterized protein